MSDSDIIELNIPTATPLVYELDRELKPIRHYYLANDDDLKKKINAVVNQGKSNENNKKNVKNTKK